MAPCSSQHSAKGQAPTGGRFVTAWDRADVDGIVAMLAEDARFTMPPLPAWFSGRAAIRAFMAERMFATPWRLVPIGASGQLAFACYQGDADGRDFRLGAINLLTLRGRQIVEINGFVDPAVHRAFRLAPHPPGPPTSAPA